MENIRNLQKTLVFFLFISFYLMVQNASGQGLSGIILDVNGEPVPFATVYVQELHKGTTANEDGHFQLSLPPGVHELRFQYLGYKTLNKQVHIDDTYLEVSVVLESQQYMLPAVIVTASGEDPAYSIMRQAIGMSQYYLNQVSAYSSRVYLKGSGVIRSMPALMRRQLEQDGVEEDRYFVTETISDIHFELPDRIRTEVISLRSSGNDNQSSPMDFVTVSLYRDINGIISPLSRSAMQVYRFELAGSFIEDDENIFRIRVIPRRAGPDLYSGYIYIREGGWNLHSADLKVEQNLFTINIRQLYNRVAEDVWMPVSQNFDINFSIMGFEIDYTYLVSIGDYRVTMNPDLDHDFYLRRQASPALSRMMPAIEPGQLQDKEEPAKISERDITASAGKREREIAQLLDTENLTNREMRRLNRLIRREARDARKRESLELFPRDMEIDDSARVRSREYWDLNRPVPLTQEELESFDELPEDTTKVTEEPGVLARLARPLLLGSRHRLADNLHLSHNGLAGPSTFNYNTVDGLLYTKTLQLQHRPQHGRHFTANAAASYAFARDRLLADMKVRYDYHPFRRAYFEVSGGRATSDFDDKHGIPPLFNTVATVLFKKNFVKLYEKDYFRVDHRMDIANGLVLFTGAEYAQRRRLINNDFWFLTNPFKETFMPNFPLVPGLADDRADDHTALVAEVGLSYTHRHYYRMQGQRKVMAYSNYPTISMSYRQGIPDLFNSDTRFNHLEASISQRFELRLIGRFNYHLAAGRFFNTENIYFADYRHFHTNPIWIKPGNEVNMFQTIDYYAYSTASDYASLHLRYDHSRLLIKRLPFLADKLLRERLFINTLLVDGRKAYYEVGYGLDQLFLLFSLEVVSGFSGGKHHYTGIRLGIPLSGEVTVGL